MNIAGCIQNFFFIFLMKEEIDLLVQTLGECDQATENNSPLHYICSVLKDFLPDFEVKYTVVGRLAPFI